MLQAAFLRRRNSQISLPFFSETWISETYADCLCFRSLFLFIFRHLSQLQFTQMQEEHSAKLQGLHGRVQLTVSQRDQTIVQLQGDCEAANEQVEMLHRLLEKQREELLADD